jgi:Tfp pilus assembly PilM family ATPase
MSILPGTKVRPVGFSIEGNVVKYAEVQSLSGGRLSVGAWGARSFSAAPERIEELPETEGNGSEVEVPPAVPSGEPSPGGPLLQPWTVGVLRKLKRYPVFASFADSDVLVKFITLPELTEQEVARMVELRHREYLPLPNAQIVYDFSVVRFTPYQSTGDEGGDASEDPSGGGGSEEDGELRVMVAGAERGTYLMYHEAIAEEGVILRSIETNQSALTRACNFLLAPDHSGTYAALYLSESYSIVNFVVEGGLYYSRQLEQGLAALTPDEAGSRRSERLLRELYRSVDFFSVESRGIPIETLYLVNGGANPDAGTSHRIQQFLAERLAVSVQTLHQAVNENDSVALPKGTLAGTLALPIGLALRGHMGDGI